MAFFELNDVFGYQDANDTKKLWADNTAPSEPGTGEVWLDTASAPFQLKRYNGTGWDIIAGGISVDSNGKLGIGTSTPAYDIEIQSNENAAIVLQRNNAVQAYINATETGGNLGTINDYPLRFLTNSVHKMTIDTTGNVGIGTTAPGSHLDIESPLTGLAGAHTNHPVLRLTQSTDTNYNIGDIHSEIQFYTKDNGGTFPGSQAYIRTITTRGDGLTYADAGLVVGTSDINGTIADRMTIDGEGNVGIGTTSPTVELEVNGDANVSGRLTASTDLVIPLSQPANAQNGSIWIR
jgi:hypothetical protein